MEANGVNYYKGVLLCSRPNESPSINKEKPFCGRVVPPDALGLVPVKNFGQRQVRKRVLPVLSNHKKWLEKFKKQVEDKKKSEEAERQKEYERLEKIKEEGRIQRDTLKNQSIASVAQAQPEQKKQQPSKHKKKEKPAWAYTKKQAEQSQQKQIDELLDYFDKDHQDQLKDYMSDEQVKDILVDLKKKIEKIKETESWRNDQVQKIKDKENKEEDKKPENNQNDDILSRISKQSGAQSVASQKTVERVQELQKKKQQKEWDKMTTSEKKTMASVDQQIAKNIADEVLRNYPALKHHSNQSIRQLLEKQAHEQLKAS